MQRRIPKTAGLALIAVALVALAFAAWAGDSDDRHHRHYKAMAGMLGGQGGFLGVQLTELTPELRAHFGVPEDAGVMVSKVVPDSPAERAGIRVGDILTRIDGEDVASSWDVKRLVYHREEGEAADLEVWRDGGLETLTAAIETREGFGGALHGMMKLECEDGEDCHFGHHAIRLGHHGDFDCGGAEDCNVTVKCHDGDCDCTVNGEEADCAELHKLHEHGE